jgi:hypothetical protein
MKNGDLPAMPIKGYCADASGAICGEVVVSQGLTKREMFAMAAMQGLLAKSEYTYVDTATDAVAYADALLAELERTNAS